MNARTVPGSLDPLILGTLAALLVVAGVLLYLLLRSARDRRRRHAELAATTAELVAAQSALRDMDARLREGLGDLRTSASTIARHAGEAERTSRLRGALLSALGRELRMPLTAILGYTELLELGIRGPVSEEQIADMRAIRRNGQQLLSLVSDFLDFARLAAGELEYEIGDVEVDDALLSVEPVAVPLMRTRGLHYICTRSEPGLTARADREKLRRILVSLLENAAAHTDAGGQVTMRGYVTDGQVRIEVQDTGCGIPRERLGAIFEPFTQRADATTAEVAGAGLGLALSRDLARGMGGDLAVRSTPGKGSIFTVSIPAGRRGVRAPVNAFPPPP